MQAIYLNSVQVNNFGENGAGKFYLHMALPAHCAGKFTCTLFTNCVQVVIWRRLRDSMA